MAILSVSQINKIIKTDIESNVSLKSVQVMGEISNFKAHYTGHFYFSLKDDEAKINCVMFSSYAKNINFKVSDGTKVILTASVGVYISSGSYQLYVYSMEPVGIGTLYLEYEALKKKLLEEGYFAQEHKLKLPKYPTNIGVISAKEGAAVRDVINTIKRRWPIAKITLIPSLVQGKFAANDVVENLKLADSMGFDVIIVARGGGSIEDLWCFNEEIVAKQVYETKTPIISAIGHETDYTIIDYVADVRAITPTAAAELATPNITEEISNLNNIKNKLIDNINNIILENQNKINLIKSNKFLSDATNIFKDKENQITLYKHRLLFIKEKLLNNSKNVLNGLKTSINQAYDTIVKNNETKLSQLEAKLDALSPLKTMGRGYSIVYKDAKVITEANKLSENDNLTIRFRDGSVDAKVINPRKEEK